MIKKEAEKVLFKDIVRSCSFKKVIDDLLKLYPDQKKLIKGYEYVFETLKSMRPIYSKEGMVIDIKKVGRGKNAYFSVEQKPIERKAGRSEVRKGGSQKSKSSKNKMQMKIT